MIKFFTSRKFIFFVPFLLVLLLSAVQATGFIEVSQRRERTFDTYNRLLPRDTDQALPVTVIDIDERSLDALGQWPWPRDLLAEIIDTLANHYHVKVIGIDAVFPEYDRSSPSLLADNLKSLGYEGLEDIADNLPNNELIMSQALKNAPVVLGIIGIDRNTDEEDLHRDLRVSSSIGGWTGIDPRLKLKGFSTFKGSVPEIEENASGFGVFSLKLTDEVFRSAPLAVLGGEDLIFPSLAIETIRVGLGYSNILISANNDGVSSVRLVGSTNNSPPFNITTDNSGSLYIYYANPAPYNDYNTEGRLYVSAIDVINRSLPMERLEGHISLIGSSAAGLKDLRPTPVSATLPGIEVHANIIENILSNTSLIDYDNMVVYEFAVSVFGGILIIGLALWAPFFVSLFLALVVIGGNVYTGWYLFTEQKILYDPIYSSGVMAAAFFIASILRFIRENSEKAFIRRAFQQYISPKLVDQLTLDPEKLELGGDQRELSIFFCDVRGFTKISEAFKGDPQGLTDLINRMLSPLSQAILDYQGTIDKYMGDCIMAFWNAPVHDPNHVKNAIRAGLAVQEALIEVNKENVKLDKENNRKHFDLAVGVGINTGTAVVGNMGSNMRFDYSVIGDSVNLASRLEGQTRQYALDIIIGEGSAKDLDATEFAVIEVDLIAVKGKVEPVKIFTVIGESNIASSREFQNLLTFQADFLSSYRDGDFELANRMLDHIIENFGNDDKATDKQKLINRHFLNYYKIMLERVKKLKEKDDLVDWQGVFVATEK